MSAARALLAAVLAMAALSGARAVDGVRPDVKFDPAAGAGHEVYREGLEERNRQRREEAGQRGGSHLDVVPGVVGDRDGEPAEPPGMRSRPAGAEAPEGAAAVPVERVRPRREPTAYREPAPAAPRGGDDGSLDAIVAALIEAINRPPDIRRIAYDAPETRPDDAGAGRVPEPGPALPRVRAGDAFYARVMHAVNSDYPGPVLIELLQPPLAGAVARGAFRLVRDRMVIRLSSLDVAGETVPIDAAAVGLDCACYGVSGEVSWHWWERVLLPAATGFVEQFLIARAEPERRVASTDGGTVVTDESARSARQARDAGLAAAAGRLGDVVLEQAPSRQTVEIPRNAELAVMFAARLERPAPARAAAREPAREPPRVERVRRPAPGAGEER